MPFAVNLPFYHFTATIHYMTLIPAYPEFAPISFAMAREISPHLVKLPDGVSEFSFAGLYLFRYRYDYQVAIKDDLLIITGQLNDTRFFITPCCRTGIDTVNELFRSYEEWKLISPAFLENNREEVTGAGYEILEDRDNYDYLYRRSDLAALSGKKFHKKKNHVNAFEASYPGFTVKPLDLTTREDAFVVLDSWASHEEQPEITDYRAAYEALELLDQFDMTGQVLYVDTIPVAWTLAEIVGDGKMVATHFEKARVEYRGAYQYINYVFAQSLPETVEFINREQDLGDEGLRQAKMTYRPVDFVKKYKVFRPT